MYKQQYANSSRSLRCLPWHHRPDVGEVMKRPRVTICQSVKWLTRNIPVDTRQRVWLPLFTCVLHLRSVVWFWSESCSEFMIMGTLSICSDVIHSMSRLLSTPGTRKLTEPMYHRGSELSLSLCLTERGRKEKEFYCFTKPCVCFFFFG